MSYIKEDENGNVIRNQGFVISNKYLISYQDFLDKYNDIEDIITTMFIGEDNELINKQKVINFINIRIFNELHNIINDKDIIQKIIFFLNFNLYEKYENIDEYRNFVDVLIDRKYTKNLNFWLNLIQFFKYKNEFDGKFARWKILNEYNIEYILVIEEDFNQLEELSKKINISINQQSHNLLYYLIFQIFINDSDILLILNDNDYIITDYNNLLNFIDKCNIVINLSKIIKEIFGNIINDRLKEIKDRFQKNNENGNIDSIDKMIVDIRDCINKLGKDKLKIKILVEKGNPLYLFNEFSKQGSDNLRDLKDFVGNHGDVFFSNSRKKTIGDKSYKYKKNNKKDL